MNKMETNHYQKIVETCGTPTFVYSEATLLQNVQRIKEAIKWSDLEGRVDINAAYFANSNPHLFGMLAAEKIGATVQRVEEVEQLRKFSVDIPMVVSPGVLSDEELNYFLVKRIPINVNLPEELEFALSASKNTGLRIDLTPEQNQRTGLKINEFKDALEICAKLGKEFTRIHTYPGTGSDLHKLVDHAERVFRGYKEYFPFVKQVDLGGGFAFDYDKSSPEDKHFAWKAYFSAIGNLLQRYQIPKEVQLSIEPGRDLFADVGELIVRVNRVHTRKNDLIQRVHTDGSYALMPSAAIRTRQHKLKFLDYKFREDTDRSSYAELNGCTTLSSDRIFPGIVKAPISVLKRGLIVIKDIGAYGACQHLEFLNTRPAAEVLITKEGHTKILTKRGDYTDRTRYTLQPPERI